MHRRISIRGCVRPSARPSITPLKRVLGGSYAVYPALLSLLLSHEKRRLRVFMCVCVREKDGYFLILNEPITQPSLSSSQSLALYPPVPTPSVDESGQKNVNFLPTSSTISVASSNSVSTLDDDAFSPSFASESVSSILINYSHSDSSTLTDVRDCLLLGDEYFMNAVVSDDRGCGSGSGPSGQPLPHSWVG